MSLISSVNVNNIEYSHSRSYSLYILTKKKKKKGNIQIKIYELYLTPDKKMVFLYLISQYKI